MTLPHLYIPGSPAEAGFAHAMAIADILTPAFRGHYEATLAAINRVDRDDLAQQADRWLANLPAQYQEEIHAMGEAAGAPERDIARFLYADIAKPSGRDAPDATAQVVSGAGSDQADLTPSQLHLRAQEGACSALIISLPCSEHPPATWIARNCDWLSATLLRGAAAVSHATPHRIPVLAVGIRGDIDIDTGLNAEGLWLHLHTLPATDDPPPDRTCISWLFWAREALETCATLDDLDRFIESTARDRGVIAVAAHGPSGDAAIFECSRASHTRHDFGTCGPADRSGESLIDTLIATNHPQSRSIDDRPCATRPGGTLGRYRALRDICEGHAPEHAPDDLMDSLAHERVEMRTPTHLRTIYSAVVRPARHEIWFAHGLPDGTPAASRGQWERVTPVWAN